MDRDVVFSRVQHPQPVMHEHSGIPLSQPRHTWRGIISKLPQITENGNQLSTRHRTATRSLIFAKVRSPQLKLTLKTCRVRIYQTSYDFIKKIHLSYIKTVLP